MILIFTFFEVPELEMEEDDKPGSGGNPSLGGLVDGGCWESGSSSSSGSQFEFSLNTDMLSDIGVSGGLDTLIT